MLVSKVQDDDDSNNNNNVNATTATLDYQPRRSPAVRETFFPKKKNISSVILFTAVYVLCFSDYNRFFLVRPFVIIVRFYFIGLIHHCCRSCCCRSSFVCVCVFFIFYPFSPPPSMCIFSPRIETGNNYRDGKKMQREG